VILVNLSSMDFTDREKKLVVAQLKRYCQILRKMGYEMSHDEEEMLTSLKSIGNESFRRTGYHCDDKMCRMILENYDIELSRDIGDLMVRTPVRREAMEEVFHVALEIQRTQLCNGQEYDVVYEVAEVQLYEKVVEGEVFMMVGEKNKFIDCAFSSREDNLNRKPHHYRRAYAESRGIIMESPREEGNLFVSDPFPYNYGNVGGYYLKMNSDTHINVCLKKNRSNMEVLVYSSGSSGKIWQKISDVEYSKEGFYVFDFFMGVVVEPASHAHSFIDREVMLSNNRGMVKRVRRSLQCTWYTVRIPGIGFGLRESLYRILYQYSVQGEIHNNSDGIYGRLGIADDVAQEAIGLLNRYLLWRGFKMKIDQVEWQGENKEGKLLILPG